MKSKKCIFFFSVIILMNLVNSSFAETGRLVDIPVPPNSSGYADFTEEEAAEEAREYEESRNNVVMADDFVGKSSDNYLKSLRIEGYKLTPNFNGQQDTYTIYVRDDTVNTFNITAESDNENAKIEGIGNITVSQEQRLINIKVTAENGDLKIYTIKIENEANKPKKLNSNVSINLIIVVAIIILIIVIIAVIIKKEKLNKKS